MDYPDRQPDQPPRDQQQNKPKSRRKIILIVAAVLAVYAALQILNAIINKDEPPVQYRPNQIVTETQ